MNAARHYSLAYLFLIVLWFALALGLWRVAPKWHGWGHPAIADVGNALLVVMLASAGAGLGGFFKNMRIGAVIGAMAMVCWLTFCWSIEKMFDWLFPI